MRRCILLLAATALAGCANDLGPEPPPAPPEMATPATIAGRLAITDALDRIVPAMDDAAAAQPVAAALIRLREALGTAGPGETARLARDATAEVDRYAGGSGGADVDAIRLAVGIVSVAR